jgi:hypothetical protein
MKSYLPIAAAFVISYSAQAQMAEPTAPQLPAEPGDPATIPTPTPPPAEVPTPTPPSVPPPPEAPPADPQPPSAPPPMANPVTPATTGAPVAGRDYPPCSRTIQDNCVQRGATSRPRRQ